MKYILVSGGICSNLGKGVTVNSIGHLLQLRGFRMSYIKLDPYLNYTSGNLSPYEHGEVFVLDSGDEVDLDFGTAERMMNVRLTGDNSITSGKVFYNVIEKERKGEYLGETVQLIPHVTDEVIRRIKIIKDVDICLIELGGTIGDMESSVYTEALRQLKAENEDDFCHLHLTFIPNLGEPKTKPTQQSIKLLRYECHQPDFIICRCEEDLSQKIKDKISRFCMVDSKHVISAYNVKNIYTLPQLFSNQNVDTMIMEKLELKSNLCKPSPFLNIQEYLKTVRIALVGKYSKFSDSYLSVSKALFHSCRKNEVNLDLVFIDTDKMDIEELKTMNGILIPGGFGTRGSNEKIATCKYARENRIPLLGICFGFQLAIIEYYRNVLECKEANTQEVSGNKDDLIVCTHDKKMVKGLKEMKIDCNSKLGKAYSTLTIHERCRHRYEVNNNYINHNKPKSDFIWSCKMKNKRKEGFELTNHPFYMGIQFHPEFLSRFDDSSPVFSAFITASKS